MILDAELAHACHQAAAIGFALVANQIGMRRSQHHIDRVRPPLQDRGHGVDHDLDALAGGQQSERQNDRPVAESEFGLCRIRRDKRKVRDAMGNDLDLVVRHAIDVAQQFPALAGHHDDLRGHLDDALHHCALSRRRRGQHRVQGRDDRHGQARQQFQDMGPGFAAENSEFVLQTDDVEPSGVEKRRSADILLDAVVLDL